MSADAPQQTRTRRGFSVFYKGKTLLSNIDPVGQAERLADTLPLADRTLYICPSPLYGYGLERLLERMADNAPDSALLCVEADEQLYRISQENFSSDLKNDKRLQLTNICRAAILCSFVRRNWGGRRFRRVKKICLSGGWQLFPELYDSLVEALHREIALNWSNALTLTRVGRLYIRNALRNLELIPRYPSISRLSFGNAPVLTLGAGPGLDTLLTGLRRHFGNKLGKSARPFRIICVDTCLKTLYARNIEPDLVVILESQHWNLRDFIGLGEWVIPAAVDLSALPASAQLPGIRPYLFFTPWTELKIFDRLAAAQLLPAVFPPLGSVGLSATAIALSLSDGPVLTGGMDFSFTLDRSHARSTPGHLEKLRICNRFTGLLNAAALTGAIKLKAKNGLQTLSTPAMQTYRDMFEREFGAYTRLFDLAGGGLPLGIQTLAEQEFYSLLENGQALGQSVKNDSQETRDEMPKKLLAFIQSEQERALHLKNILTGKSAEIPGHPGTGNPVEELETLVDQCNYLWAHFPDYAETNGQRPSSADFTAATPQALSFLNRVRMEIDPVLRIFETIKL